MSNKNAHAGEIFLNLICRSSGGAQRAVDALVFPDRGEACNFGELGEFVFEIVNFAAGKQSRVFEGKASLEAAFVRLGLSEKEAEIAAASTPSLQYVSAPRLRRFAQQVRGWARTIDEFNQRLDPFEREWLNEKMPPDLSKAEILYRFFESLVKYADGLDRLARDWRGSKKRGRPGLELMSLEMQTHALMSYVVGETGRVKSPPFKEVATILQAAYRHPAVAGPEAKIPAIFRGDTLRKSYRRRHPRRR